MAASWSGPGSGPTEYKVAARGSRALAGSPRFAFLPSCLGRWMDCRPRDHTSTAMRHVTRLAGAERREIYGNEARTKTTAGHDDDPRGKASPLSCPFSRSLGAKFYPVLFLPVGFRLMQAC